MASDVPDFQRSALEQFWAESGDLLWMIDAATGQLLEWNPATLRQLQFDRATLQSRSFVDLDRSLEDSEDWNRIRDRVQAQDQVRYETSLRTGGGPPLLVEFTLTRGEPDEEPRILAVGRVQLDRTAPDPEGTDRVLRDDATGLATPELLEDRLRRTLRQRSRSDTLFALVYLALDDFYRFEESFGRSVGDSILRAVGARLKRVIRPGDTAARYGEHEFVLLLRDLDSPEDVTLVARRVLGSLRQPLDVEGNPLYVSPTAGIVLADDRYSEPDAMLRDAEAALESAKRDSEHHYWIHNPELRERIKRRVELRDALAAAVEHGQLECYYQPIVDLDSGATEGLETLVRWHHPDRGTLTPSSFLPLAERTDAVLELDRWVLDQLPRVFDAGPPGTGTRASYGLSVNLSSHQLTQIDAVATFRDTLGRAGVEPERVTVEVSESTILHSNNGLREHLRGLREQGIRVAADDFARESTSFELFRDERAEILKLDRSLIRELHTDGGRRVLRAVLCMADHLQLVTVAEGVEEYEQLVTLRALGCDYAQGFYFAEPAPLENLPEADSTVPFG